jgi:hypothetical protein
MITYKIEGFDGTMSFAGTTVDEMSGFFKLVVTADGVDYRIDVPAKLTGASDICEKRLEVYAPQLPKGVNIRADQLQAAISGYFFAFLNDDESLKNFRNHGQFD